MERSLPRRSGEAHPLRALGLRWRVLSECWRSGPQRRTGHRVRSGALWCFKHAHTMTVALTTVKARRIWREVTVLRGVSPSLKADPSILTSMTVSDVFMVANVMRRRPALVSTIAGDRRPGKLERQTNQQQGGNPQTHKV